MKARKQHLSSRTGCSYETVHCISSRCERRALGRPDSQKETGL